MRQSANFPSTPLATCRGGRSLLRTRTCSPSWSISSASPSGMPGTLTSCARASTAGPGYALNMRSRSTRKPAQPTARRSNTPPEQSHSARHNPNRATAAPPNAGPRSSSPPVGTVIEVPTKSGRTQSRSSRTHRSSSETGPSRPKDQLAAGIGLPVVELQEPALAFGLPDPRATLDNGRLELQLVGSSYAAQG